MNRAKLYGPARKRSRRQRPARSARSWRASARVPAEAGESALFADGLELMCDGADGGKIVVHSPNTLAPRLFTSVPGRSDERANYDIK
jgi:hypothetical protein